MKRSVYIFVLLALLGLPSLAGAQSSSRRQTTVWRTNLPEALEDHARDVADEYLDILDQLLDVLEEYQEYLSDLDENDEHRIKISYATILANLRDQVYNNDPKKLLKDVNDVISEIKDLEAQHKVEQNTNTPYCCRVTRNFRRDLSLISELIEDYTEQNVMGVLNEDDIQKYIEKALQDVERALKNFDRVRDVPEAPEIPDIPKIEITIPDMPVLPPNGSGRILRPSRDEAAEEYWQKWLKDNRNPPRGRLHDLVKSVSTRSSNVTIDITNPGGDIWIEGNNSDQILARFGFVVRANTAATEAKFIELSGLDIDESGSRFRVEARLPKLTDTRTEVLKSVMVVSVPQNNRVECQSSFGAVTVLRLNGQTSIRCENSKVLAMDIRGDTRVSNSMGPILLENIRGDIIAQNSYGEINMIECASDQIEIENLYAPVSLTGIRATETDIESSGAISVTDHTGSLFINSAYGQVDLNSIRGDVDVTNAYQGIVITEITGMVHAQNSYANIEISDVSGMVTVSNERGSIRAFELSGPVDLNSNFGNIYLMIGDELASGSSLYTNDGTINLTVSRGANLLVKAHTVDGTISSSEPITIIPSGGSKTAELILGEGSSVVDLSGDKAAIVINAR